MAKRPAQRGPALDPEPTSAAVNSLPRRGRFQAARAAGAAAACAAGAGNTIRRVQGDLRALPPDAAELGQAAPAGVRDRPGALPELWRLKIIAAILEVPVIKKMLTHLGMHTRAPLRAPARGQALQAA